MSKHTRFFVHGFSDLETANFSANEYSLLKFGSDTVAKKFARELATNFFASHSDALLANRCVVIPSPYNHVKNAATILTEHFVNFLNELIVQANGDHVEFSMIHRKVSYTNDYGFLSKEKRKGLIANDRFFMNKQFLKGKTLIFVDDIRITGTHEDKLVDILADENMKNDCFFIYYANYFGNSPDIEAALNFSSIKSPIDYLDMTLSGDHHVIVRPIKYILGMDSTDFESIVERIPTSFIKEVYYGCLGEGYYKIPAYQTNFNSIKSKVNKLIG